MTRSLAFVFLLIWPISIFAVDLQTRQIRVRVLDISRRPVHGIRILVTENGIESHPSDQNGRTLLTLPLAYRPDAPVAVTLVSNTATQWVIIDYPDSIHVPSSSTTEVTITVMRKGDVAILTNRRALNDLVKGMVQRLSPSELRQSVSPKQKDALIKDEAKRLGVQPGEFARVIELGITTANSSGEKARLQTIKGNYLDAINLYDRSVDEKTDERFQQVLERALAKYNAGEFRDAATDYEIVLRERPNNYGIMTDLGLVLIELGQFVEARAMLDRALKLIDENAPNGRTAFLANLNLSFILRYQSDLTAARAAVNRASAIATSFAKPLSHEMGWLYNNYAALDDAGGHYDEGFANFNKALRIFRFAPEPGLSPVIMIMNIAFNRLLAGELDAAKKGFDRAEAELVLLVKNKSIKANHPIFATLHNYVGGVYDLRYDFAHAFAEFEKGLDILKSNELTAHPDYGKALANLAKFYDRSGDSKRARDSFEKALQIQIAALGPDNADVANTYAGLGLVLLRMGDLTEAEADQNRAIAILEGRSGFERYLYSAYSNRAGVYLKTNRPEQALSDLTKACDLTRRFKNQRPLDYSDSLLNLADQKRGNEAEALAKEAVDVRIGIKGLHPDGLAEGLLRYGLAFGRDDKYVDAEHIWKQALTLVDNPPDRPVKGTALNNLGEVYRRTGRFGASETFLLRALELWHHIGYDGREEMLNTCRHYRQLFIDQKLQPRAFEGCPSQ